MTLGKSPEINGASLLVCNGLSTPVELFGQVDECANCALENMTEAPIEPLDSNTTLGLSSVYAYSLEIKEYPLTDSNFNSTTSALNSCHFHVQLDEFGEYVLNIGHHPNCGGLPSRSNESICEWRRVKAGSSTWLPLVILSAVALVGLPLLYLFARVFLRALAFWSPKFYSKLCSVASYLIDPRTNTSDAARKENEAQDSGSRTKHPQVAECVLWTCCAELRSP